MTRVYKILKRAEWESALETGAFEGSAIDRQDGFIHFSAADQAAETARKYFRGQDDLMILAIEAEALGAALRWEVSRDGALFPHLYGLLPCTLVAEARPAPLGDDGAPLLGDLPA